MAPPPHFLLITFPAQGHVNPSLRFARRLIKTTGARVTFVTCLSVFNCSMIPNHNETLNNLCFLSFSDGFDDGVISSREDVETRIRNLKSNGDKTISQFIEANSNGESPVTCLIYTILLNWAPKVARRFHLPSSLLWIQPAFVFDIYYNHFAANFDLISDSVQFPNLPALTTRDLPSFLTPSNTNKVGYALFQELMEYLKEESNLKILVNTFDSLEPEALMAIPGVKMVAIGPLLPSESEIRDSRDESYRVWLDSKTESSVIYIAFGTMVELTKKQLEEVAKALIEMKRPFLWVITDKINRETRNESEEGKEIDKIESFRGKLEEIGMIVSWCSQVEVLKHRAVGCFLSHCGWNSMLESLVLGVPVVGFPVWSDQPTTAKLLEDLWKIGVRVKENEEGVVESGEIRRCLGVVMEEKAAEVKEKAEEWKRLAAAKSSKKSEDDKTETKPKDSKETNKEKEDSSEELSEEEEETPKPVSKPATTKSGSSKSKKDVPKSGKSKDQVDSSTPKAPPPSKKKEETSSSKPKSAPAKSSSTKGKTGKASGKSNKAKTGSASSKAKESDDVESDTEEKTPKVAETTTKGKSAGTSKSQTKSGKKRKR